MAALAALALVLIILPACASTKPSVVSVDVRSTSSRRPVLSLVPLPKAELGPDAASLPLGPDSGPVSNRAAAAGSEGQTTLHQVVRLGRLVAYQADYGNDLVFASPVGQVLTGVVEYRTAPDERRAVADFVRLTRSDVGLSKYGLTTNVQVINVHGVPGSDVALRVTYRPSPYPLITCINVNGSDGRFEPYVVVCGRSWAAVGALAPKLENRVSARLRLALHEKLRGRAPQQPKGKPAGPPSRGPKPAALALRPTDFGQARVASASYIPTGGLSAYRREMTPAGPYAHTWQTINLTQNPASAITWAAHGLWEDSHRDAYADAAGVVHVSQIHFPLGPDHVRIQAVEIPEPKGQTDYQVDITLTRGPWLDQLIAEGQGRLSVSSMRHLAALASKRLDHGLRH